MATSRSGAGSPFWVSSRCVRRPGRALRRLQPRGDHLRGAHRASPFRGSSTQEVNQRILDRDPRPPRQIRRQIPGDLETICMQALEKDPERRYAVPTASPRT